MVLRKEITIQIKDLLQKNPQGLSITDIIKAVRIDRNTAGRYLENLLVSGQVDMRRLGMAKIYVLSQRVPLSAVLSISSELIIQMDSSLRIIFANEPFIKLVGTESKNLLGKNIEYTPVAMVFDESFSGFIENIREGITGKEWSGEIALNTKNTIVFCRIAPTVFDDGRKGVSVIFEDITQRKLADGALRESEDRYRKLVEISPDAVLLHKDGKIIYANPATFRLLGASHSDEIIGKNVLDFIPAGFKEIVRKNIQKDLEGQTSPFIELPMNRIDGTSIFVEGKGIATIIDGEPAVQVAIRDISEQKRAAEALQKSEDQYRTLAEASNDLIFVIGRDDRVEYVNSFASALVNKTTDLIIGHPRSSLFPPEVARNQKTALDAVFDSGTLIRSEGALTFDGRIHWFDYVLTPVKNPDGRVRSVLGISRDITERKRVETALRESEARLRLLLDSTEDLIFMQDPDGRYLYFNSATRYGVLAEEMLGSTPFDFLDKETADRIMERLKNVAKTGQCIREEIPLVWKGQTFWFSDSLSPVRDVNGTITAVVTISQNITDRKHADIALRESEEKYRTLVDRANDVICVIQEGIIKMCNPRLTEFWGGSVEEMLGRPFTDFIHPDALSEVIDHYNRRMCGVSPPAVYETILMRKDGCRSFVELNAGIISYEGKPADLIIIRDMNDRKKIQDALRESEATARALINAPTDSVILMDSRGVILALNETAALRFGKRSDELVGILPDDLLPKEVARSRRSKVAQILEKKEMVRFEDERDGRWYDTVAYPVVSETREVNKIAIIARDITDRRNADEALIHSEQRFRNLITAIADIVWETDSYARFVYVSPQVETILGYTADELIGHTPFEFLQPETISTNQKKFQTAVEKHERSVLHMSHWIHKDGHEILLESNAIPMYDSDGSFSGFIGIDRQRK